VAGLPRLEESELFSKEQNLGQESRAGGEEQSEQRQQLCTLQTLRNQRRIESLPTTASWPSSARIEFEAQSEAEFVVGPAAPHDYGPVLGSQCIRAPPLPHGPASWLSYALLRL
jgi:hypothetical protein